ncbi:hypothetical protein [Flavisphingomonas formosensis]|uniref:hypothetical protein n=1 Tax=Flavisphingomonas formosensis TaxID=861534 RepID=UPI0012FC34DE|nr:hypothetical protein [Sphingomonas formosensis]
MKTFVRALALFAMVALPTTYVCAQAVPPLPADLRDAAAVACVRIDDRGWVSGAFLIQSTGEDGKDRELVNWIRQLRWPHVKPGEQRNRWAPMPIAVGDATVPSAPHSCAPKAVEADVTTL